MHCACAKALHRGRVGAGRAHVQRWRHGTMRRQLSVAAHVLRSEGIRGIARRLLFTYSRVQRFSVLRLDLASARPASPEEKASEIIEVSFATLDELRAEREDLPEYFYRDRWEPLDRCWISLADGRLAFVCFVSFRGSSGMVRLGGRDAELAYIYAMPEIRGRSITARALRRVAATLRSEGVETLWATPNALNRQVLRAFAAVGFSEYATVWRYGPFHRPRLPIDPNEGTPSLSP